MIRGLLFDLDGVLVNTNPLHARAWQELAEELGIPFTPADQEAFLGISRAQCLEILLKKGNRSLSESEKERLCTRKNDRYREMIGTLTPAALRRACRNSYALPGPRDTGQLLAVSVKMRSLS